MSSIAEQIRFLEELAAMDAALKTLADALGEERGTLEKLKATVSELDARLERERASLATTERARGDCHAEVRTMTQQIDHSREKLNRSRTERESNAAQRELEELRKLLKDREDDVQKLSFEAEATRKQVETTEAELAKVKADLAACEDDIQKKMVDLEKDHSATGVGRDALVKGLPPALYRRYEMIRQKRGFAVATTTDGTCKACNMSLAPQMFHKLRREPTIDQCPTCNRIIYYTPPVAKDAPPKDAG
ncbi:MAG: hypothetical protein JNL38_19010 [Myxococcales bacterium]|nr:hypothetical protein [Myxococcales bacterium]